MEERCPNGIAPLDSLLGLTSEPVMDYPVRALMRGLEGETTMRLTIGCDGVVKKCEIVSSSGHEILDDRACEIMERTAFDPPRNAQGQSQEKVYTTSLTFSLG